MRFGFFDWYWTIWLLAFLGPELYWVFVNSGGTLSWSFWDIESINLSQPFDFPMWTSMHWAVACFVWLLFGWLSLHIPFGLLR